MHWSASYAVKKYMSKVLVFIILCSSLSMEVTVLTIELLVPVDDESSIRLLVFVSSFCTFIIIIIFVYRL